MGLDNGICVKRNEKAMNVYDKLKHFEESWDKEHKYDFEIAYFRKCWNVRHSIAMCLNDFENNGYTPIKRDDIPKIIAELKSFNKKTWDEGDSIWTWEEQKPHMQRYIKNLQYLHKLMAKHDLDVYFYDSY